MNYQEIEMSPEDFTALLVAHKDADADGSFDDVIRDSADNQLSSGIEGYPEFSSFTDVNGKNYVVETNTFTDPIFYEFEDAGDDTEPCEYILRATVGSWDGDFAENLAVYRLEPEFAELYENADSFSIWITYYYQSTLGAPLDRYVRVVDTLEQDESPSNDDYQKMEFESIKAAEAWIAKAQSGTYVLNHNESDRPSYQIVN